MPIHVIGGSWLFLTSFIFFWPTKWPVVVSGVNGGDSSTDNSKCAQTSQCPNHTLTLTSTPLCPLWALRTFLLLRSVNYTCVIVLVTLFCSMCYWFGFARHHFKGPLGRLADAERLESSEVSKKVEANAEPSKESKQLSE